MAPIDFINIIGGNGDGKDDGNDDDDDDDDASDDYVVVEYGATLRMPISMVIESTLNLRLS